MPTNRHISARHQCIKIASNDALSWAEQTRREVFNDMLRDGDGEWPAAAK